MIASIQGKQEACEYHSLVKTDYKSDKTLKKSISIKSDMKSSAEQ